MRILSRAKPGTGRGKGASVFDVHKIFAFFYLLPLFVRKIYAVCTKKLGVFLDPLPLTYGRHLWISQRELQENGQTDAQKREKGRR